MKTDFHSGVDMGTGNLFRAGQPGDVCIILEPSAAELSRLRGYQRELQADLGGQIVAYVHVTCQRFRPDNAEHLQQIVSKMIAELSTVRAFPLMAGSIVTLHSEFWQSTLARWTVQESAAWQSFISKINGLLLDMSCPPHYPGDKPPTCSALEHIPSQQASSVELSEALPQVLFEAHRVIFSRVEGAASFTLLGSTQLGFGTSMGGDP